MNLRALTGALGVAALLSAAVGAAGSDRVNALTPTQRSGLVKQFAPILYFNADETWAPVGVERFLALARIERQTAPGKWTRTTAGIPTTPTGCKATPCYRFNLPCSLSGGARCYEQTMATPADWKRAMVYGRVVDVPVGTPPPAGITATPRYLVRYWLFYPFDDWRSRGGVLWQAHEADWESVSVALDGDLRPIFAAYSQHCSGTVRPWTKVDRVGTHPVDYVALGSHANYFDKTSSPTQFLRCVYRNVAQSDRSKARRIVKTVQSGITDRTGAAHKLGGANGVQVDELTGPLPSWARFPGRWSEGELLWVGRAPTRFTRVRSGLGPGTPSWNATSIPTLWHTDSS